MSGRAQELAAELARLITGERPLQGFPWLSSNEQLAVAALGKSALQGGRAEVAQAAYAVLTWLSPEEPLNHLMLGHAKAHLHDLSGAYVAFGQAIQVALRAPAETPVAGEALLARGDLLLRLGRRVEARADLADALLRIADPSRSQRLSAFLAS